MRCYATPPVVTIKIVFLPYYFKESRQNSTVEEDSEGDNDSEEFYYGGQVSTRGSPDTRSMADTTAQALAEICACHPKGLWFHSALQLIRKFI